MEHSTFLSSLLCLPIPPRPHSTFRSQCTVRATSSQHFYYLFSEYYIAFSPVPVSLYSSIPPCSPETFREHAKPEGYDLMMDPFTLRRLADDRRKDSPGSGMEWVPSGPGDLDAPKALRFIAYLCLGRPEKERTEPALRRFCWRQRSSPWTFFIGDNRGGLRRWASRVPRPWT